MQALKFNDSQELDFLMCENLAKFFLVRDEKKYTSRSEVKLAFKNFCEKKGPLFTSISVLEYEKTVSLIWKSKQLENIEEI